MCSQLQLLPFLILYFVYRLAAFWEKTLIVSLSYVVNFVASFQINIFQADVL